MIGTITPAETATLEAPATGRRLTQLTSAPANSYPLYYFVPAITGDGRYLVFHSERSGTVQLYRLDLETGAIGRLTDGRTRDAGWAIWCEWHLDGIYNHLSALNPETGDVFYFEDEAIRAANVHTLENRLVAPLDAGRMPIGQAAFSPDGRRFAYIHTDAGNFLARLRAREAEAGGDLHRYRQGFEAFRETIPTTLAILDTETGEQRVVAETDYHFHHVLFLDDDTLLVNHPRGCHGIWTVRADGTDMRHLRPADAPGAHGAEIVHGVVTERGIAYEAVDAARTSHLGLYDPATGSFVEGRLSLEGYCHAGRDPRGRLWVVECDGPRRHALYLADAPDKARDGALRTRLLHELVGPAPQQRRHAHPFVSDDGRHLFFTDRDAAGFSQIFRMDIDGLAGPDDLPAS